MFFATEVVCVVTTSKVVVTAVATTEVAATLATTGDRKPGGGTGTRLAVAGVVGVVGVCCGNTCWSPVSRK